MNNAARTRLLYGLTLFLGLTAVGGGIALLAGLITIPLSALAGSPFTDFTVPAILLAAVVGGISLLAAWLVHLRVRIGAGASLIAGGAIIIFEIVEWHIIGFAWLQAVYLGVGAAIVALAAWMEMDTLVERSPSREPHRVTR